MRSHPGCALRAYPGYAAKPPPLLAYKVMSGPYPLVPKSSSRLIPGQFWSIPLSDGRFACGRVIQIGGSELPAKSRGFFGGLHAWVSSTAPTADAIAGMPFLRYGAMHIRAITRTGGSILGHAPLHDDALPSLLSAMGGPYTKILIGADSIRIAERSEWGTLPVLSYWGYLHIRDLAENHFVQHTSPT